MARDLSGVLDAVLAGIVVLDESGHVELVNAAACRMLETSAQAAIGRSLEALLGSDHSIPKLAQSVRDGGRTTLDAETRVERRFSEDLVVDVAASPLAEDGSSGTGVVLFLRDRTVQNRLVELVADRERLGTLGQIAAGIAHEVKNPLGGIRGAAEILASRAKDGKDRDAAELIVREAVRIATLVDDLMVFARSDELRLGPVNIHRILDDVLDLLAMDPVAGEVDVKRVFDPSIPEIEADASRLTQVFLNLARNALQAMKDQSGTLTIETRVSLAQRISASGQSAGPTLVVTLGDTGPGMEPAVLAQLGTPFFTTREAGTGLGLAVAQHWVLQHGGSLTTESTPGQGTSVQVALPLRRSS
ncbi:MAG: PAS domain-containing protein [Deltaproteobacteria bacterium]|nr:PAS domain-containing protein [Deltaproteobacteria bacterium]